MVIFLILLLILGAVLEAISVFQGLKHTEFTYSPTTIRTEAGAELALTVTVTNHSLIPISYLRAEILCPLNADLPEELVVREERFNKAIRLDFRLWGRQRIQRTIPLRLDRRGVYHFGDADVYRGDFLGLKEYYRQYEFHHEVLVYPKLMDSAPLKDSLGTYCGELIAQRHLIRDPILTLGVREYSGREAMKTISWTQSARRGQLMVREFDYTRDLSCTVMLATDGIDPRDSKAMDRCCSMARTVCQELTDRGVKAALYTNAPLWGYSNRGVWSCGASPGHLGDVLETLARLYTMTRRPARDLAVTCAHAAGDGTAFILIAPTQNDAIRAAVSTLQDVSGAETLLITADDPNF